MQQSSILRSSLVSCDQLEPRRLFAGDSPFATQLGDGSVVVTGTTGRDIVHVILPVLKLPGGGESPDSGHVVVRVNGKDATFETSTITSVEITPGADNDIVRIDSGIHFDLRTLPFYVNGGAGNDTIIGGDGDDTLTGAGGRDYIDGRDGRDRLNGLDANDHLIGNQGVDRLFGGAGNDLLDGGKSTDYLWGEGGNDTILGVDGDDSLDGGGGDDSLVGDGGDDTLFGGAGNDVIDGGTGHDTVFGNAGDDTLQLRDFEFDVADGGSGNDTAIIDDIERTFIVAETKHQ
jgi:Ca2+-binding RTX toxin-like protein